MANRNSLSLPRYLLEDSKCALIDATPRFFFLPAGLPLPVPKATYRPRPCRVQPAAAVCNEAMGAAKKRRHSYGGETTPKKIRLEFYPNI